MDSTLKRSGMPRRKLITALEARREELSRKVVALCDEAKAAKNPLQVRCCEDWKQYYGGQLAGIDATLNVLKGISNDLAFIAS